MSNLCSDCLYYVPDSQMCKFWGDMAGGSVITCRARKPKAGSYISRDKLEQWILTEMASLDTDADRECVIDKIREDIPDADVKPVVHGIWMLIQDELCECSACCSYWIPSGARHEYAYCPRCGAEMDGEE